MRAALRKRSDLRRCASIAVLTLASASVLWGQTAANPQATPSQPSVPPVPQLPVMAAPTPAKFITLEEAIELAKKNNPSLQASRTLINQNQEQEITANLRPNPVLAWDAQFLPIFSPSNFNADYINTVAQFDVSLGYLFERGRKRQHRLAAAKDITSVTEAQVADTERTTVESAAQQFIAVLLADANLQFAKQLLDSYQRTVAISQERHKAGGMSTADLLKIQLQTLQFQSDVAAAEIARLQALDSLRQLLGFDSVPREFDVSGQLSHQRLKLGLEDLQAKALQLRPDLQAARRNVQASHSQIDLAKANAKQDLTATFDYSHVTASNNGSFFFSIPLPIFNRNQGEVARTYYVLTQSQFQQKAAEQAVLTDVRNAYEALLNSEDVLELYEKGYIQRAQQSLEITQFSYQQGAASLLDFLDAERSYRSTELSYRQALATHMVSLEQLKLAVGTRELP